MDIFDASKQGNLEEVRRFIDGGNDINIQNTLVANWTPLLYASIEGHFEVVKFLLEHGANVNLATSNGTTPLMVACNRGHLDVVKLLLQYGAHLTRKYITCSTDLKNAFKGCIINNYDILLLLLQYSCFFGEEEKEILQKQKYRCSFGTIAS